MNLPTQQFENTTPAQWVLVPDREDEELISGYNLLSGETFKGTREEFNKRLRGK